MSDTTDMMDEWAWSAHHAPRNPDGGHLPIRVLVEAEGVQWDGTVDGATPIIDWITDNGSTATYRCDSLEDCARDRHRIAIRTADGEVLADPGTYIVRGIQGEFYLAEEIDVNTEGDVIRMGGKPSKGTKKDKRLKGNRRKAKGIFGLPLRRR